MPEKISTALNTIPTTIPHFKINTKFLLPPPPQKKKKSYLVAKALMKSTLLKVVFKFLDNRAAFVKANETAVAAQSIVGTCFKLASQYLVTSTSEFEQNPGNLIK